MRRKAFEPAEPQGNGEPVALLIGLDGHEQVWTLAEFPPPQEILLPKRVPVSVLASVDPPTHLPPHRRFRLQPHLRDRSHRWWEVYNEGRTRTPQDGFVYFEERHP